MKNIFLLLFCTLFSINLYANTGFPTEDEIILLAKDQGGKDYYVDNDKPECLEGVCNPDQTGPECFYGYERQYKVESGNQYSGWVYKITNTAHTKIIRQRKRMVQYLLSCGTIEEPWRADKSVKLTTVKFGAKNSQITVGTCETIKLNEHITFYDSKVSFSGTGVSGVNFNPSVIPSGNTVTITVTRSFANKLSPKSFTFKIKVLHEVFGFQQPPKLCTGSSIDLTQYTSRPIHQWQQKGTGNWEPIPDPANWSPKVVGDWEIKATRRSGDCEDVETRTISVSDGTYKLDAADITACEGSTAELKVTQPDLNLFTVNSITFSANNSTVNNKINNSTDKINLTGLSGGNYKLEVTTNLNGCVKSGYFNLTVHSKTPVSVSSLKHVCKNAGNVNLNSLGNASPSGGQWIAWNKDRFKNNLTSNGNLTVNESNAANWSPTESFTYRYTNSNSCVTEKKMDISFRGVPEPANAIHGSVCEGGSVALGVNRRDNRRYDWYTSETSNQAVQENTHNFTTPPLTTTTSYYVSTRRLDYGCWANTRTEVIANVRPKPEVNAGGDIATCDTTFSKDLSTQVSPAGGTFTTDLIKDNFNINVIKANGLSPGDYYINYTYTDTHGCTNDDDIKFSIHPKPTIDGIFTQDLCVNAGKINLNDFHQITPEGGTITGTGILENLIYDEDKVNFTYESFAETPQASFEYRYENKYGCIANKTFNIDIKPMPKMAQVNDGGTCNAGSVTLSVNNQPEYHYNWFSNRSMNDTLAVNTTVFTTKPLTETTSFFVQTKELENNCVNDTLTEVKAFIYQPPTVNAGNNLIICNPEFEYELKDQVNPKGGTFSSNVLDSTNLNGSIFMASGLSEGDYTIQYNYTDPETGCQNSDNFMVTYGLSLQIEATNKILEIGDFTNFSHNIKDNLETINWDFGDGFNSKDKEPTHYYNIPGKYDIIVDIKTKDGCQEQYTFPEYIEVIGENVNFVSSQNGFLPNRNIKKITDYYIYPNPLNNQELKLNGIANNKEVTIKLINQNGIVLINQTKNMFNDIILTENYINSLSTGIYLLHVQFENTILKFKVNVQ